MLGNTYDAIVVGGGHNGLVAASYLARAGKRTVLLERRPVVGGAAVTEQPWGPGYKVTMLSYVVSLLPPTILRDLQLERHGYRVHPQGPYFVPYPDGRSLQLPDDPVRRRAEIAKFSDKDADAYEQWDALAARPGRGARAVAVGGAAQARQPGAGRRPGPGGAALEAAQRAVGRVASPT